MNHHPSCLGQQMLPAWGLPAWATCGLHALVLPWRLRRAWEGDQVEKTLVLWEDAEMRWSGILLLSMPRGMEQPGREKQCLSEWAPRGDASWLLPPPAALCALPCASLQHRGPCTARCPCLQRGSGWGELNYTCHSSSFFSHCCLRFPVVQDKALCSFWCCCLLDHNEVFHLRSPNTLMPPFSPSTTARGAPKHKES